MIESGGACGRMHVSLVSASLRAYLRAVRANLPLVSAQDNAEDCVGQAVLFS